MPAGALPSPPPVQMPAGALPSPPPAQIPAGALPSAPPAQMPAGALPSPPPAQMPAGALPSPPPAQIQMPAAQPLIHGQPDSLEGPVANRAPDDGWVTGVIVLLVAFIFANAACIGAVLFLWKFAKEIGPILLWARGAD